jgi:hypothetical protein
MAQNKNQHFVPQFYLSAFSFDEGARTNLIRAVLLKSIKAIGAAGQCQGDYFYGKNLKFEEALSKIEGAAATVIREIIRHGDISPIGTNADAVMKAFVCLQWTRTLAFSEGFDSGFSQMIKGVFRDKFKASGFSDQDLAEVEIGRTEGPRESVAQGMDFIPFFWDLEAKLVCANDLGEFVTSDDPVLVLNPFYQGRFEGGISGAALEGTLVLFPISPDYLIILYDRGCYRVGATGKGFVPLGSMTDLVALNNYQYLNAHKNVYHRNASLAPLHISAFDCVKQLRTADRQVVREIQQADGNLIHTFTKPIDYRPEVAIWKILRSRRHETGTVGQIPPRDPALSKQFEAYTKSVRAKKARRGFLAYMANIADVILSDADKARLRPFANAPAP